MIYVSRDFFSNLLYVQVLARLRIRASGCLHAWKKDIFRLVLSTTLRSLPLGVVRRYAVLRGKSKRYSTLLLALVSDRRRTASIRSGQNNWCPRSVTEFSPGKVLYQHVSIYLHAGMFVCLFVYLFVCLFVYLFICLSVPFIIFFLRQIMSFTSVVRAHKLVLLHHRLALFIRTKIRGQSYVANLLRLVT